MKALLVASCLTLAVLPMCKPDAATSTDAALHPASLAAVRTQFDVLRDSADANWQRLTATDDQKLRNIHALVHDLRQVPGLDQNQLRQLGQAADQLKRQRYDRQTMATSELIDRYDNAQDSVLQRLYPLAAPGGNAPSEAIRNSVEAIQLADNYVIPNRVHYDRAAKAYNAYLQLHRAELARLGGKYARLRPLPLFELPR